MHMKWHKAAKPGQTPTTEATTPHVASSNRNHDMSTSHNYTRPSHELDIISTIPQVPCFSSSHRAKLQKANEFHIGLSFPFTSSHPGCSER